jgi:hypothetical protein
MVRLTNCEFLQGWNGEIGLGASAGVLLVVSEEGALGFGGHCEEWGGCWGWDSK